MLLVNARVGRSTIHGFGLFAQEPIAAGTVVWRFNPGFDVVISAKRLSRFSDAARSQVEHYAFYLRDRQEFVLSMDDDRFTNHAEDPNTRGQAGDPFSETVAVRDIAQWEEITCSYREFVMLGFPLPGE